MLTGSRPGVSLTTAILGSLVFVLTPVAQSVHGGLRIAATAEELSDLVRRATAARVRPRDLCLLRRSGRSARALPVCSPGEKPVKSRSLPWSESVRAALLQDLSKPAPEGGWYAHQKRLGPFAYATTVVELQLPAGAWLEFVIRMPLNGGLRFGSSLEVRLEYDLHLHHRRVAKGLRTEWRDALIRSVLDALQSRGVVHPALHRMHGWSYEGCARLRLCSSSVEDLGRFRDRPELRSLDLRGSFRCNQLGALAMLADFPGLKEVALANEAIRGPELLRLSRATDLHRLDLCPRDVPIEACEDLGVHDWPVHWPGGVGVLEDADLEAIEAQKSLRSLTLFGGQVTDDGLARLARLPSLKTLRLIRYREISGRGFAAFAEHQALQELHIIGATQLDDAGLKCIAGIPNLRVLRLDRSRSAITPVGLRSLAQCATLDQLGLGGWFGDDRRDGGDVDAGFDGTSALRALGRAGHLRTLLLNDSGSFDLDFFAWLEPSSSLETLVLDGSQRLWSARADQADDVEPLREMLMRRCPELRVLQRR